MSSDDDKNEQIHFIGVSRLSCLAPRLFWGTVEAYKSSFQAAPTIQALDSSNLQEFLY